MIPTHFTIPSLPRWLFGRKSRTLNLCATKPAPAPHPSAKSYQTAEVAGRAFSFFRRNPLGLRPGSSSANKVVHTRRRRILGTVLERRE